MIILHRLQYHNGISARFLVQTTNEAIRDNKLIMQN